ncbi:Ethanolamine utilisation protein EutQ [Seminavis robusta]|uniref:Ethanolamine utilisation protein EutQ n=1 Tax=Seminavis robusta TaxID=568900 RepID=A0A9N8DX86_9STRA|nr:Ethanolamine utilisation protein EutQ [Seminavis robusta]|eukprot:Sro437_g142780.1 Ethanolamine utilisation protein EutQ (180) ;mRNA; r:13885-14424
MLRTALLAALVFCLCRRVQGFTAYHHHYNNLCSTTTATSTTRLLLSSSSTEEDEIHPAVLEWPDKYCSNEEECGLGPRVLHMEFTVEPGSAELVEDLDALNWPTWTTANKEKWAVGNQNADKIMPYGELSYVLSGKLEIIPSGQEEAVIVGPGDLVTFPKGFQASWRVLEELTWHYFLY